MLLGKLLFQAAIYWKHLSARGGGESDVFNGYAAVTHWPSILRPHTIEQSVDPATSLQPCLLPACMLCALHHPNNSEPALEPVLPLQALCSALGSPGTRLPLAHSSALQLTRLTLRAQHRWPGRAGATNDTICCQG